MTNSQVAGVGLISVKAGSKLVMKQTSLLNGEGIVTQPKTGLTPCVLPLFTEGKQQHDGTMMEESTAAFNSGSSRCTPVIGVGFLRYIYILFNK